MASKLAPQSLNDPLDAERKTLMDRSTELQKQINQKRLILRDLHNVNLKGKKGYHKKNQQIAPLEQKLSKLKLDLKEVEHTISERGSKTNFEEVKLNEPQDSTNDIGTSQDSCNSALVETDQSESKIFVPKDENNVMKPACRKCKRRFVILDECFKRTAKQNASYAEMEKVNEKLLEETAKVNKSLERFVLLCLNLINFSTKNSNVF